MSDITKEIECVESILATNFKNYLDKGIDGADISVVKETADAIKDLAQAKYYCKVTKAMEDSEKEYLMGYNATGYNGRSGGRMGYEPYMDEEPYINDYISNPGKFKQEMARRSMRMGYDPDYGVRGMNNMYGYMEGESILEMVKKAWKDATPTEKTQMKQDLNAILA